MNAAGGWRVTRLKVEEGTVPGSKEEGVWAIRKTLFSSHDMEDTCWSPSSPKGLGISALPSPSGVIWKPVPFPSPATNCFPRVLHETQLTPSFMVCPLGPLKNCRFFRFAIMRSPLVVTAAKSSAFSGVGFGVNARKETPLVDSSKADCVLPCMRACIS